MLNNVQRFPIFTSGLVKMQREIDALLATYLADRDKETRVVQALLTVLAVGSAERKRMLRDLAAAVGLAETTVPSDATHPVVEGNPPSALNNDFTAAIDHWRATRSAAE